MAPTRRVPALLLTAALLASACGGGSTAANGGAAPGQADASDSGGDGAGEGSARLDRVELVWVLDGEPVEAVFDYSDPIARDRYDAGLRLDVVFETTGDLGFIAPALAFPVTINGDSIRAGSTVGPERSPTRPDREAATTVQTDAGFTVQLPVGRPLSPISLDDARERAVEFGLSPDEEVIDLGADLTFDAARINDIPAAPQNGRNEIDYEVSGTIEFGSGLVIDVTRHAASLTVEEAPSAGAGPARDCATLLEQFSELFAAQLAEPDTVLLSQLRGVDTIRRTLSDLDCNVRDFRVPACTLITEADGPETIIDPLRAICPNDKELIEATEFDPRFEAGVVRLVVPTTVDGLPAYSVAMSWPAWTFASFPYVSDGQGISLSADPDLYGGFPRIDIAASAHSAALLEGRIATAVEPEVADAEIVLADTTTVAGLPARRLIAQIEQGAPVFQVGTAVEIDMARVLTITGVITGTEQLPVDGAGLAALLACVESSMVIVEFEPGVDPAPAADCTSLTELSASELTPEPVVEPDASYENSLISITVPGTDTGPAHIVTVATPPWPRGEKISNDRRQSIKVGDDESNSIIWVVAEVPEDGSSSADDPAALLNDEWILETDEIRTVAGRDVRVVVKEWVTKGSRRGTIIVQLDEVHPLTIKVHVDGPNDFDAIFAAVLDSITITP